MENQNEFIIKLALEAWQLQINRATKLFESLTDAQLQKQVAPNRNSGVYLLGHLTAIHDAMFSLLGIGERLYPQLDTIFEKIQTVRKLRSPRLIN
jgi:hypothetical protein